MSHPGKSIQQRRQPDGKALNELLASMTLAEKKAAQRFCETCEDGEDYDVPKAIMRRLVELGLAVDKRFGRYQQTNLLLALYDDGTGALAEYSRFK